MVEIKLGRHKIDLPYTLRVYGVSPDLFYEMVDEETKADLIDGVMIVRSPASPPDRELIEFLRALLNAYVVERGLGEVLAPGARVQLQIARWVNPDLAFRARVPAPRLPPKDGLGIACEDVPDLVLEVLPPFGRSYRRKELDKKRRVYQDARVREIWSIDPYECQIIVDCWQRKRYDTRVAARSRPIKSTIVPGFWLDPAWLWHTHLRDVSSCLRTLLH